MSKTVDEGWNSEIPTFRRELKQDEFIKEIKKEWTGAKIESNERENLTKSDASVDPER